MKKFFRKFFETNLKIIIISLAGKDFVKGLYLYEDES